MKVVRADAEDFVAQVAGGVTVWPWEWDHPLFTEGPVATVVTGRVGPAVIEWSHHGPSVETNSELLHRVNVAVAAILTAGAEFQSAVRKHIQLCFAPAEPVTAEQLNAASGLPWGEAGPKATTCGEGFQNGLWNGVTETVSGAVTMTFGWLYDPESAAAAWTSLGETFGALGIGLVRVPGMVIVNAQGWDGAEDALDPGYYGWLKETQEWTAPRPQALADGFAGSEEEWATNPAEAGGGLVFNLATILLPVKGGSALLKSGVLGSAAERLALSGRVTELLSQPLKSGPAALQSGGVKVGPALQELATAVRQASGGSLDNLLARTQAAAAELADRLRIGEPALAGIGQLDGLTHRVDTPTHVDVAPGRFDSVAPTTSSPRLDLDLSGGGGRFGTDAPAPVHPVSIADIIGDSPVLRDGTHIRADGSLEPNVWYQAGEHEYFYHTDANGYIDRWVTDDLQMKTHEGRLDHDRWPPGKLPGDHAGHLAGDRFGGSPKLDNVVSQLSSINLSEYRKVENLWASTLTSKPPGRVSVDLRVETDPATGRPNLFIVDARVNGVYQSIKLRN